MLKAFADESSSGDSRGIFTVSGYIGRPAEWEEFSEKWAAFLAQTPSIPFFRMASLRSKEWRAEHGISKEQADAKVATMESLLIQSPHILYSDVFTVTQSDFTAIISPEVKRFRLKNTWLKTPYNYAFQYFVRLAMEKAKLLGVQEQIDFVFDCNDALFRDADKMLRELKKGLPEPYASTLGTALPGNNERIMPLQAADLLAARIKDHCMNPGDIECERLARKTAGTGVRNITVHAKQPLLAAFARRLSKATIKKSSGAASGPDTSSRTHPH